MSKSKGKGPENRPVRLGDVVTRCPVTFNGGEGKANLMRGTVVYVHPKGRFHVVEFPPGIREAFHGVSLLLGGGFE